MEGEFVARGGGGVVEVKVGAGGRLLGEEAIAGGEGEVHTDADWQVKLLQVEKMKLS